MATPTVLKDFLVNLGFKIDGQSQKNFTQSVEAATNKIMKFGAALTATALTAEVAFE